MKKKWKASFIPIIIIFTFLFFINPGEDYVQHQENKISRWNKKVQKIEGTTASQPTRSIASISSKKNPINGRLVAQLIPHQKFKERLKSKYKMAPNDSFKYRSLAPDMRSDFKNGIASYKFLDHFYAIKDTTENRLLYPDSEIKLGHIIVKSNQPIVDSLPVVENEDTGHLGVFTGILKVKLKDMGQIDNVITHNNYFIVTQYQHINLVLYQIDDVSLAITTLSELLQNPMVSRASLEILEYSRHNR